MSAIAAHRSGIAAATAESPDRRRGIDVFPDELVALKHMRSSQRGDVVAVTALGMRAQIFAWLRDAGATRPSPASVRAIVRSVRSS